MFHQVRGAVDGLDAGQIVGGTDRKHPRTNQAGARVRILAVQPVDNAQVSAFAIHFGEGGVGFDGELQARAQMTHGLDARHQPALGKPRHHHDAQPAFGVFWLRLFSRFDDQLQGGGDLAVVLLPRRRQVDPARGALEQLDAQPVFQQLHVTADGRLGHVQGLGGFDIAAQPGRGIKGTHRVERRQTVVRHGFRAPSAVKFFNSPYVKIEVSPPQPLADNRSTAEQQNSWLQHPNAISILPRKIISMARRHSCFQHVRRRWGNRR
ncbi:hypothetical protein D3C86_1127730 [compost metagenome]